MPDVPYCARCRSRVYSRERFCAACGASLSKRGSTVMVHYGVGAVGTGRVQPQLGRFIGDYMVLDTLGSGGMGIVHRVLKPRSGQEFALKLVNREFALQPSAAALLEKEARTQARIVHPNVVRLIELAHPPEGLALVMELIRGHSVEDWIDSEAPGTREVRHLVWVAAQMAAGLAVVHGHDHLHRDVKPGNFLYGLDELGRKVVKIADFGIATDIKDRSGKIVGTPGYMAPEILQEETADRRADLYALGCVFFRLFTGEPVFPFDDLQAVSQRHCSVPPRDVRELRPETPRPLAELVTELLDKSPARRPSSASQVMTRLREHLTEGA